MTIYKDKDIVKSKCVQLYQIAVVKDGWGWLYTNEETGFLETIEKHIDILCENFKLRWVSGEDAVIYICCYETDESYTLEGEAECISLYKRYEEGCPTVQDNPIVKRVDILLNQLWAEKGKDNG
jgi:hypothetical protein